MIFFEYLVSFGVYKAHTDLSIGQSIPLGDQEYHIPFERDASPSKFAPGILSRTVRRYLSNTLTIGVPCFLNEIVYSVIHRCKSVSFCINWSG